MNSIVGMSRRRAALVAGSGYLAIFVLAMFANFLVRTNLIETGDPVATAANIRDSEGLFRVGMVAFLVIFLVDVVVAWALYVYFRGLSNELSLLSAWFRVVYTVFLGVALVFFFVALQLLSGDAYLDVFRPGQLDATTLVALDAFDYAWLIGLAAFGVHLIVMGYLVVRSAEVTRLLGYVLAVAGVAYIVDTVAHALLANYDDYESLFLTIVVIPSVVGELGLTVWLLARGGRTPVPAAA